MFSDRRICHLLSINGYPIKLSFGVSRQPNEVFFFFVLDSLVLHDYGRFLEFSVGMNCTRYEIVETFVTC